MKLKRSDLDKIVKDSIRKDMKEYQLKSRGIVLYKREHEYFLSIIICVSGKSQERIQIMGFIKPYIIDDIFWKVFHMPENSKEPMGLRANGAFKIDPLEIFEKSVEYGDIDKIENISRDLLKECHEKISSVLKELDSSDGFLPYVKEKTDGKLGLFDYNLVNMLLLINDGKYQEAKVIADEQILNKKYGRFKNEGKFIYEHIVDFCVSQMK